MPKKSLESFTQTDAKSILDTAQAAWDKAKRGTESITFTWNGDKNEGYLDAYKKWKNTIVKE